MSNGEEYSVEGVLGGGGGGGIGGMKGRAKGSRVQRVCVWKPKS